MDFKYTRYPDNPKDALFEWFLEKVPGLLSWGVLVGSFSLIFIKPLWGAAFIVLFELYWLVRMLYMTCVLVLGYLIFELERKTDWLGTCKFISTKGIDRLIEELRENANSSLIKAFSFDKRPKERFNDFLDFISKRNRLAELSIKSKLHGKIPGWEDIYHVVIFPVVNEKTKILKDSLDAIINANYPKDKFIVVVAIEERAGQEYIKATKSLVSEYSNSFMHIECIIHPDKIQHEARVKGANITFAAKKIKEYLDKNNINLENVIVSTFDSDTCAGTEYFSCLTYHYIINPDRVRRSYQPVPMYNNNIWEAPSLSRIMEIGSSFWIMMESTKSDTLVTFSSHSMSFKALYEVDYWPTDMISDDSAIYWKSYLKYDSNYEVQPLYTEVSMNMVSGENTLKTCRAIYKQKRRWAYGVENFPVLLRGFLKNSKIPLLKKLSCLLRMLDTHIAWATWAFIITISGWLFLFTKVGSYNSTVLSFLTPKILSVIINLAGVSMIVAMILSVSLLPKHKKKISTFEKIKFASQWVILPFIYPILGALPALDAQTKLLIGKKMRFHVTPK